MRTLNKFLLTALVGVFTITGAFGQTAPEPQEKTVTFKFPAGQDMFYIPWGGNNAELNRLYALVDEYRAEITGGSIPIYVDGYCTSGENAEAGFKIAVARSNRVKSELIINKGLTEDNFITKNHTTAYTGADGVSYRDMVVVTLRIPAKAEPDNARLEQERREREAAEREAAERAAREQAERERQAQAERERTEKERAEHERAEAAGKVPEPSSHADSQALSQAEPATPSKAYCFAVRTNLLYDAFLLPTLGAEWRVSNSVGVRLDGSRSWWGDEHGKVQKIWLVSPEVRWYMGGQKRFYAGASANFGEYNVYKGMLGGLFSGDTGYQGKLWGAGLTVGYQLYLSRSFSLDFNLGLGYTRMDYDSFTLSGDTRIYKEKDKSKNFWGPTQAGISLVWQIGR